MQDDVAAIADGIGSRLRAIRIVNGATLEAVARATGISLSTLSRLESAGLEQAQMTLLAPASELTQVQGVGLTGKPEGAERA
jgi:transcriptional regulator with XRE-family HTH domain